MDGPGLSLSKSEDSEGNVERDPGEVLLRPVATNLTSARAKLVLGLHWPPASLAPSCRQGGAEMAGFAHAGGEGGDAGDRARCRPRNRDHSDLMLPSLARARRGLASRTRKKGEPQEPGWRRPQLPAGRGISRGRFRGQSGGRPLSPRRSTGRENSTRDDVAGRRGEGGREPKLFARALPSRAYYPLPQLPAARCVFPTAALSNPVRLGSGRACARNQAADVTVEPFAGVRCPSAAGRGCDSMESAGAATAQTSKRSSRRSSSSALSALSTSSRTNAGAAERTTVGPVAYDPDSRSSVSVGSRPGKTPPGPTSTPRARHRRLPRDYGVWLCSSKGHDPTAAGVDCGRRQPRSLRRARRPTSPCRFR